MVSTVATRGADQTGQRGHDAIQDFPEARHRLSSAQVQAIRSAMHLFVEEDLARTPSRTARRLCERCEQERPGAGFIDYDASELCNSCATVFELARARGIVQSLPEFLRVI